MAELLSTSQSRLSKLERGALVVRDVQEMRFIAERSGVPVERLGLQSERDEDRQADASEWCDGGGPVEPEWGVGLRDGRSGWLVRDNLKFRAGESGSTMSGKSEGP